MFNRVLLNAIPTISYLAVAGGMLYVQVPVWLYFLVSLAFVACYFTGLFLGAKIKADSLS